jgi:RNA-splicing ligase RtcB
MITMRGKYAEAIIMANSFDEITAQQIMVILNHPAMAGAVIRIMPDLHAGTGCVIGFTMTLTNSVIPNLIGVDIGCAVIAYELGDIEIDLVAFDQILHEFIPTGPNGHVNEKNIKYINKSELDLLKIFKPHAKIDMSDYWAKIGTLGGGNHFIEIDKDPQGKLWLVIHSGSRHFGNLIAQWHQHQAKKKNPGYHQLEWMTMDDGGRDYLRDMQHAQYYATINRRVMARIILDKALNMRDDVNMISSIHNYINFSDNIVRKGAISAHEGEQVIIPMNMAFGCVVGLGKGNAEYNYSAPHGAGRLMSRGQAKKLSLEKFQKDMEGIYTTTANESTLDECPDAYKNPEEILEMVKDTVNVSFIMKPILSFKDASKVKK